MSDQAERLYPLLFAPVLKSYIWGGRNLERLYNRPLPEGAIAESWEIAGHEQGTTWVANGRFAGLPLTAVQEQLGLKLIGRRNAWASERGKFPLLIKLLDAHDKLSLQVHPDDDYAIRHEGNELGKTEMWVILHTEPDAAIILGLRRGATAETFRAAIEAGAVEEELHHVPVSPGDFVCVPSGTIHAILGGIVIAEIQQNSNTTYRVFDWNRTENGRARPLHIDKAMDVTDFARVEPQVGRPRLLASAPGVRRELLCDNQYFTTERITLETGAVFTGELTGETLEIWGVIDGSAAVSDTPLNAVQFTLLPAAMGPYRVTSAGGAVCLRTYVSERG